MCSKSTKCIALQALNGFYSFMNLRFPLPNHSIESAQQQSMLKQSTNISSSIYNVSEDSLTQN